MTMPDSQIWMIGHTSSTIYDNAIRLIFESPQFAIFRPYCVWSNRQLRVGPSIVINTLGAKDEGAVRPIQGKTFSLCYCDEMTLYPDNIIDMIDTRLSTDHSMLFASMNPSYPSHKLKKWIERAEQGDNEYYSLHFTLPDNTFLAPSYVNRIKNSLSGVFYKRNYLGIWCLAEGAIFDFFDKSQHVVRKPPCACEYWILGIDYGTRNAFAAVLIGINTGNSTQTGKQAWVEKEYYWDCIKRGRQKTDSEFADDIEDMVRDYPIKNIYLDPSAASFKVELQQKRKRHVAETNNEVTDGIRMMISAMKDGWLTIMDACPNLIREVEGYVWDDAKAKRGEDEPVKSNDHAVDALRYAIASHKIPGFNPDNLYRKQQISMQQERYGFRGF
jgi:PBSX family phage terminase large subunit